MRWGVGLNHHHLWPGRGSRQGKIPGSVSPSKVLLVLPRRHVRWMVAHRTNQSVFPREALQRQRQLHQVKGGVVTGTGTESSRRWFCGSQLLSSPVPALRFLTWLTFLFRSLRWLSSGHRAQSDVANSLETCQAACLVGSPFYSLQLGHRRSGPSPIAYVAVATLPGLQFSEMFSSVTSFLKTASVIGDRHIFFFPRHRKSPSLGPGWATFLGRHW